MKRVEYYKLEGKRYPLVFTYAVSEYIEEKFESFENFSHLVNQAKTAADVFIVLNHQGCEYVKKRMADMPIDEDICLEPITREELTLILTPASKASLITAISGAFEKSIHNEIKGKEKGKNAKSA